MSGTRSVAIVQKEIVDRFAELTELATADGLVEAEVGEAAVAAERLRSMAEAHCARTAGMLAVSRAWTADGARSAKDWLAWRTHLPKKRLHTSLHCGRRLTGTPRTETAFLAGDLGLDHVRLLNVAQRTSPEAFADGGEAFLIDQARELLFSQFERVVRYWCYRAAPDDGEDEARQRYNERELHCSTTFGGTVVLNGTLDPTGGGIFARELDRLATKLFEEDLAEGRERLGTQDPPQDELRRTPAQRRADALVLMARRSAAKPPGAVEPRILLHVLVGLDSLARMCQLSDGTVLTPGEVLPTLALADVERVVFGSPSKVIDVGHRRRFFEGATRTAVQLRDLACTHPACDVPFDRCEVDHIVEHSADGPTNQDNGRCRCPYHHRRARDSGTDPPS